MWGYAETAATRVSSAGFARRRRPERDASSDGARSTSWLPLEMPFVVCRDPIDSQLQALGSKPSVPNTISLQTCRTERFSRSRWRIVCIGRTPQGVDDDALSQGRRRPHGTSPRRSVCPCGLSRDACRRALLLGVGVVTEQETGSVDDAWSAVDCATADRGNSRIGSR